MTAANDNIDELFTTNQAATLLKTTVRALLLHIQRGNLKPDYWGGRGAFKSHRFTRQTLLTFAEGKKSA